MGHVVTGVLVVDADQTHFDVSSLTLAGFAALIGRGVRCFFLAAAGGQAQGHDKCEKQCKNLLLHSEILLYIDTHGVRNDLIYCHHTSLP